MVNASSKVTERDWSVASTVRTFINVWQNNGDGTSQKMTRWMCAVDKDLEMMVEDDRHGCQQGLKKMRDVLLISLAFT